MKTKFLIEVRKNNTTICHKIDYNCLSLKQKSHLGIKKIKKFKTDYINHQETQENIDININ